jgi:hypothetical protein
MDELIANRKIYVRLTQDMRRRLEQLAVQLGEAPQSESTEQVVGVVEGLALGLRGFVLKAMI